MSEASHRHPRIASTTGGLPSAVRWAHLLMEDRLQPGDAVMVEALTAPGIKAACRQLRLPLHEVALDGQGIVLHRSKRSVTAKRKPTGN